MFEGSPAFDVLLERDSDAVERPDISFLADPEPVPVVGLVLGHPQPEYGEWGRHEEVHEKIRSAVYARGFCVVSFDTRVDPRSEEFRSPAEVETLVYRMDLVLTTRMHGMVHALKGGVPFVAVDPISGGAKVQRQAKLAGWPAVLTAEVGASQLAVRLRFFLQEPERVVVPAGEGDVRGHSPGYNKASH